MSTDKRRKPGWLFDDIWRKLASLILATGLWLWLDARLDSDQPRSLILEPADLMERFESDGASKRLIVRLDERRYEWVRARHPETGATIDEVSVQLRGTRSLLDRVDEEATFESTVPPAGSPPTIRITKSDLRTAPPRYERLLASMDPPELVIELAEIVEKELRLREDELEFSTDQVHESVLPRLQWGQVAFAPQAVRVVGRESAVDAFLDQPLKVALNADSDHTGDQVIATLQLAVPAGLRIEPDVIEVRVPLLPPSTEVLLPDVPVLLDAPGDLGERFKLTSSAATVRLDVRGTLSSILSGKSVQELRAWALEHARLVATIPADAVGPGQSARVDFFVRGFAEHTHFEIRLLPTISFEPNSP